MRSGLRQPESDTKLRILTSSDVIPFMNGDTKPRQTPTIFPAQGTSWRVSIVLSSAFYSPIADVRDEEMTTNAKWLLKEPLWHVSLVDITL